jgi:XTP/dITP diphosphohydrolase
MTKAQESFARLLEIMDRLRAECPWDKKQTIESLRHLTIEETYELADAILNNNMNEIKKELGDVLLHIVFYAKIGSETGDFNITDVIDSLCEKLIYRHPHVFGEASADTPDAVSTQWEALKLKEKDREKRLLSGVPKGLPAMVKASRVQQKVRAVGFDWSDRSQVWDKVHEEINELKEEMERADTAKMEKEFGDVFFSLINVARMYGIDPETALERTNQKFIKRFNYLEEKTLAQNRSLTDMHIDEMEALWQEAKQFDK